MSWWDCMQWWAGDNTVSWLPVFLPMLWPIVVIGGIVALAVLLLRNSQTPARPMWRDDAFDILRERFARGEIDRQEYEERKGLLSQP